MDELEISGKRYISTRRAGREHQYHADYIGQLIRGGKIQAQKVGRSWYVDEDSLAEYLGKEPTKRERLVEEAPVLASEPIIAPDPVKEVEEAPVEKQARVTPWKKIPEVSAPVVSQKVAVASDEAEAPVSVRMSAVTEVGSPAEEREETGEEKEVLDQKEITNEELGTPVTIRTSSKEEKKNVTYVEESTPVFPVKMRKAKKIAPVAASEVVAAEEQKDVVVPNDRAVARPLQYGLVAMLGVFAFIVVGGMSYLLSYKATVEGDQMSASITVGK